MENLATVLAIDFDGTIAEHPQWPDLGTVKEYAQHYLRLLREENYYIIIWTCREGNCIENIKVWLDAHEIPYDQINQHHPKLVEFYKNDTRKICADIYVDDRNLFGLPDWHGIYKAIKNTKVNRKCLNV